MIVDGILLVFQGLLNVILLPLTVLNISVDIISSIPVVSQFLQVVAYIVPWDNLLPLIIIVIAIFTFRIGLAIIRLIVDFIPFL